MATISGQNSTKNRALVIERFGDSNYLDVSLDVRGLDAPDTNPHLATVKRSKNGLRHDGTPGEDISHSMRYSDSQIAAMEAIADKVEVTGQKGFQRTVMTLNADLQVPNGVNSRTPKTTEREDNGVKTTSTAARGTRSTTREMPNGDVEEIKTRGFIINTKTLAPPEFPADPEIIERQFTATRAAQLAAKAAREAKAPEAAAPTAPEAPTTEAPATPEAPAQSVDELQAALDRLKASQNGPAAPSKADEAPSL